MTMIEQVARAMEEALRNADAWPEKGGFVSTEYGVTTIDGTFKMEVVARAVIEAMRRPTQKMLQAADDTGSFAEALRGYSAMIDTALSEDAHSE